MHQRLSGGFPHPREWSWKRAALQSCAGSLLCAPTPHSSLSVAAVPWEAEGTSCLLSLRSGSKLRGLFVFSTLKTEDLGSTRLINSPQNQISLSLGCEWPGTQRAYGPSPGSSAWLGELGRHQEPMCSVLTLAGSACCPRASGSASQWEWDTRGGAGAGSVCHWSKTCPSLRTSLAPTQHLPRGWCHVTQGSLPRDKCHWSWVGSHLSENGTLSLTHFSWLSLHYRSQIPLFLHWVCFVFLLSKYTSLLGQPVDVLCVVRRPRGLHVPDCGWHWPLLAGWGWGLAPCPSAAFTLLPSGSVPREMPGPDQPGRVFRGDFLSLIRVAFPNPAWPIWL